MIFDVTKLSKIVYLDSYEDYSQRQVDEYDEFVLYIVKRSDKRLSAFYGSRSVSNIVVVKSLPTSPSYPDEVAYLVPDSNSFKFYYKARDGFRDPTLLELSGNFLTDYSKESDSRLIKLAFSTGDEAVVSFSVSGKLGGEVLRELLIDLNNEADSHKTSWEVWR